MVAEGAQPPEWGSRFKLVGGPVGYVIARQQLRIAPDLPIKILDVMSRGANTSWTASALGVTERTVEENVDVAMRRYGAGTIAGAVAGAIDLQHIIVPPCYHFHSLPICGDELMDLIKQGYPPDHIKQRVIHVDSLYDALLESLHAPRWNPALVRNAYAAGLYVPKGGLPLTGWAVEGEWTGTLSSWQKEVLVDRSRGIQRGDESLVEAGLHAVLDVADRSSAVTKGIVLGQVEYSLSPNAAEIRERLSEKAVRVGIQLAYGDYRAEGWRALGITQSSVETTSRRLYSLLDCRDAPHMVRTMFEAGVFVRGL